MHADMLNYVGLVGKLFSTKTALVRFYVEMLSEMFSHVCPQIGRIMAVVEHTNVAEIFNAFIRSDQ